MKDMVQVRRGPKASYSGPDAKIGRSQFNRSHGLKMTFDASYLYPILIDEVLPGDTFTCSINGFARIFSPLDAPVMDNIELETFFFFCPNRLLWDRWVDFMGEHRDVGSAGAQDTDYTIPVLDNSPSWIVDHDGVFTAHGLAAYMGLPEGLDTNDVTGVNALPFRMYNLVYNEWFRDQNLTGALEIDTSDGDAAVADYAIVRSSKKHDYFTSALPYLQKGTAISVALAGTAEIHVPGGIGVAYGVFDDTTAAWQLQDASLAILADHSTTSTKAASMYTDLTSASGVSINALRQSVAIQRLLETDARGGTRYVEIIKAHFGVTSPDFRLQRPEYLGGGRSFINITAVANSSATATEDQGELRGVGTGVISGHSWAKSFTEHGYVMGLVRARGDITYFQGMDRMWSRSTRYDFYLPALANLGEQSILNQEIFVSNVPATDVAVFGYQERWNEYRMKHSRVVGAFNPDVTGSLSFWHLAEDFSALPALNTAFVRDKTPMDRITTVDTEPDFLLDIWFNFKCARPIPVHSIPSLLARF